MKSATILLLLLALGCGPAGHAGDSGSDRVSGQRHRERYRLVGLPTGPRLFFDQARCLQYLRTYSDGMEAGLGRGSSTRLRCEPE